MADMFEITPKTCSVVTIFTIALLVASVSYAASPVQSFALTDTKGLVLVNVTAEVVQFNGRTAVRLTKDTEKDGFALLRDTNFQDGTIEADIALKVTTPTGVRMPGFVGMAFRAQPDASRYELFYLRPGNSSAQDQAMRNHSVQYVSEPDFDWYTLRREWPWVYESHADLKPGTWTKLKISVKGRSAKLFLNELEEPSLIVDGLKGEDLKGAVALWPYAGEEAYFSNIRITNDEPLPLNNDGDPNGNWQVKVASDAGPFDATLQLRREGRNITGVWAGALGSSRSVTGTWRDGYVELRFDPEWPADRLGKPGNCTAVLAGWIDGDSANGRFRVEQRTDGQWTATRKR